jgi:alpha-L-rhamnosidase
VAACAWRIEEGAITVEAEIPANTSATVYLPGQEGAPLEIGAGRHRWSYPFAVAARPLPHLTLDSTVGELVDHPQAYAAVMQRIAQHNPEFVYRLEGQTRVTLRAAIRQNPNAHLLEEQITRTLAALAG